MDSNIINIEVTNILVDVLERNDDYSQRVDITDLYEDELGRITHWLMKRDNYSVDYLLEANMTRLRELTILVNELIGVKTFNEGELIRADITDLLREVAIEYYREEISELIEDLEPTVREELKSQYDLGS